MGDLFAIFLGIDSNLELIALLEKSWLMESLTRSSASLSILSVPFCARVTSRILLVVIIVYFSLLLPAIEMLLLLPTCLHDL